MAALVKATSGQVLEAVEDINKDEYDDSANEGSSLLGYSAPEETSPPIVISHHRGDSHFGVGKQADHEDSRGNLK